MHASRHTLSAGTGRHAPAIEVSTLIPNLLLACISIFLLVSELNGIASDAFRVYILAFALKLTWDGAPQLGLLVAFAGEAVRLTHAAPAQIAFLDIGLSWVVQLSMMCIVWRWRAAYVEAINSARRDSLTGLPNRRALEEFLEGELARAHRFSRPLTVAMIDCDGFKQLNDRLGHVAGDDALKEIGDLLRSELRSYDGVFRLGGDEFVIVLPETGLMGAEAVCERLRTAFAHRVERVVSGLTASLGVVVYLSPPAEVRDCLQQADAAMYRAKRQGPGETVFEVVEAPRAGLGLANVES